MPFLNSINTIPDKIFPRLEAYSYPLYIVWREVCHLFCSCFTIFICYLFFIHGYVQVPWMVFIVVDLWITFQEFYLHPKQYHQPLWKGIADWSCWMVPFIVFITILYK